MKPKVLAKEKFPAYAKHLSSEADVICYMRLYSY